MSKTITTLTIDEDKLTLAKLQKLNISKLLDDKLTEVLRPVDVMMIRDRRLNAEKSLNAQKMVEADKYGATKG